MKKGKSNHGYSVVVNDTTKTKPPKRTELKPGQRKLFEVGDEIQKLWPNRPKRADEYLQAIRMMNYPREIYSRRFGTGRQVVEYFLKNSTSWTGADADRLKGELLSMIK